MLLEHADHVAWRLELADTQIAALAGQRRETLRLGAFPTALVQACRDVGFDPHIVATTSEPLATRSLIARELGVGLIPSLLKDEYGGIAIRPVKEAIRHRDVYALLPPGDRHPRARQVVDALIKTATDFHRAA